MEPKRKCNPSKKRTNQKRTHHMVHLTQRTWNKDTRRKYQTQRIEDSVQKTWRENNNKKEDKK